MKDSEYEQIETQALGIVHTINSLKQEIEDYGKARHSTEDALASLNGLVDEVAGAVQALRDTSVALSESDYGSILNAIDTHVAEFGATLERRLGEQQPSEALLERFEQLSASMRSIDERVERIERLEAGVESMERKLGRLESLVGDGTDVESIDRKLGRLESLLGDGRSGDDGDLLELTEMTRRITREVRQSRDERLQFEQEAQRRAESLNVLMDATKDASERTGQTLQSLENTMRTRDNAIETMIAEWKRDSERRDETYRETVASLVGIAERIERNVQNDGGMRTILEELRDVIARIDRNTQKGFGKERG